MFRTFSRVVSHKLQISNHATHAWHKHVKRLLWCILHLFIWRDSKIFWEIRSLLDSNSQPAYVDGHWQVSTFLGDMSSIVNHQVTHLFAGANRKNTQTNKWKCPLRWSSYFLSYLLFRDSGYFRLCHHQLQADSRTYEPLISIRNEATTQKFRKFSFQFLLQRSLYDQPKQYKKSQRKSLKITIHLYCLIPTKWVPCNDPSFTFQISNPLHQNRPRLPFYIARVAAYPGRGGCHVSSSARILTEHGPRKIHHFWRMKRNMGCLAPFFCLESFFGDDMILGALPFLADISFCLLEVGWFFERSHFPQTRKAPETQLPEVLAHQGADQCRGGIHLRPIPTAKTIGIFRVTFVNFWRGYKLNMMEKSQESSPSVIHFQWNHVTLEELYITSVIDVKEIPPPLKLT